MRLKRLYLKGYANIYNAMARKEIEIDFSKCIHSIIVLRSENGSGKSSIINELHPFFSSTTLWLEDTDIQKTIEFFLEDGTDLSITYYGWRAANTKQKPSRCYIQRTMVDGSIVELNPTGNMTSGKDIISDLLDISDDYMNLAAISASSTGIGAMKPSERKRFLSLIVNSVTPFVKLHKTLVIKYSIVKSMITTINAKIIQLGNIEVIQSNMNKAIAELQVLDKKRADLIQEQTSLKAQLDLLSKDGSPIEKYKSLIEEKASIGESVKNVPQEAIQFDEIKLRELEDEQISLQAQIEAIDKILTDFVQQETQLRTQLEEDKIQLESLYDKDLLLSLQQRLESAKKELNIYISRFETLDFHAYDDITEEEYKLAVDAIEKFNNTISFLASQYSRDELIDAVKYISLNPDLVDCNSLMTALQTNLDSIKEQIKQQLDLISQSESYTEIPIDCKHKHDCPFIISIVKAQESKMPSAQLQTLYDTRDEIIRLIEENKKRIIKQDRLMQCIYQVRELVTYITSMSRLILKFPNTQKIKNTKHIIDCIENASYLDININQYREYTNYIILISSIKRDITSYEEKLQKLTNSNKESLFLQRSIEEKTANLGRVSQQKLTYLAEINGLKNRKLIIDNAVCQGAEARALKLQYEEKMQILQNIESQLSSLTKDVELFKSLSTRYGQVSSDLNNLNLSNIPELQNLIEQSKYQMLLYEQYTREYQTYSELFNKIEMVKKYSSINGIQADIMDYTMNQILSMVNQLTTMMFNGRFMLHKFEITATDFMISFMDKEMGIIRPDISMMSASQLSQLSMIISFVLLHNASQKFNIIRLDEVDNNLDNDNRLRFVDLVYNIMRVLNFHQAILISHNTELDLTNCDLIITRLQNQEAYRALLHSGANIIADFNK